MKLNNENINGKRENTGKDSQMLKYVKVPENHIVIDFDLKDENGEKSKELNLQAAAKFPPTCFPASK